MAYKRTTATQKITKLSKRIRAIQGGTAASKTVSIVLYLIARAQSDKKPTTTSIVSESLPHLKRGAMKDFLQILKEHNYFDDNLWNKSDFTYTFETGSKIEFFSVDQPEKVRGPRRERLFINEANNIPHETFDQLEVRTSEFIFLDWNPVSDFWFYEHVLSRPDVDYITLTYKDNEALDKSIVESIEKRMARKDWWTVYGLGLLGEVEGKIYRDWKIIDSVPHEARLERYGVDFGYTNDPTAIVAVYYYNGGYIVDQIAFQKGLSNKQIADLINNLDKAIVVADSAEPKSIDEMIQYGLNVVPAKKGPDSVRNGIQVVQTQRISMTKRSVDVIKEYRNYLWQKDREGKIINEPEHIWSHSMDAIRYAINTVVDFVPGNLKREQQELFYRNQSRQRLNSTK